MDTLILGLIIFFAIHLLPTVTPLHKTLKSRLGENPFKALFALLSLAGFILIIIGMGKAEFVAIYEPPAWGRHATSLLVLIALFCLISSGVKTSIRSITAHPMLWGISAWSSGHLLANGDQASLLLFGSFLLYSLFDMFSANRRGAHPNGRGLALKQDGIVLVVSALIYIGLMFFHESFTGMPIME